MFAGYSGMSPGTGDHREPLVDDVYPPGSVPFGHSATHYIATGINGDLAQLDDPLTPSLGVHGRAEIRRMTGIDSDAPDYNQWALEARAYVPVFAKRRVIALRGAWLGVEPLDDEAVMPFYRLPQSHSPYRFIGYSTQRFRDNQLVLGHAEYRWIISHKVSALALYEVGAVAPDRSAFRLDDLHTAWGGGLRFGRDENAAVRLDVGYSVEGLHATVKLGSEF